MRIQNWRCRGVYMSISENTLCEFSKIIGGRLCQQKTEILHKQRGQKPVKYGNASANAPAHEGHMEEKAPMGFPAGHSTCLWSLHQLPQPSILDHMPCSFYWRCFLLFLRTRLESVLEETDSGGIVSKASPPWAKWQAFCTSTMRVPALEW